MINTHEKLLRKYLKEDLYEKVKQAGYEGSKESMFRHLIYALEEISAYICDPRQVSNNIVMTETEYFQVLAKTMNDYV